MTIKSIKVQQKFEIGEIWFCSDAGYPEAVTIASKPYLSQMGVGYQIQLKDTVYGTIRTPFLGDFGVTGHRYDGRPCKLSRTLEGAKRAVEEFNTWSDNIDYHF